MSEVTYTAYLMWGVPDRKRLEAILPGPWRITDVVKKGGRDVAYCVAAVPEGQSGADLAEELKNAIEKADDEHTYKLSHST